MKGIKILLTGVMVALVAVMLPCALQPAYAAEYGYGVADVPAESAEIELGGGEAAWVLMEPVERGHDTAHIEKLLPAESFAEAEMGAGETIWVLLVPPERVHDTGRIEALLPAE